MFLGERAKGEGAQSRRWQQYGKDCRFRGRLQCGRGANGCGPAGIDGMNGRAKAGR